MRKLFSILLLAALAVATASATLAGTRGIDARERHQQYRIREGIRDGQLTRREAERLEAQQARIRVDERFAKADGHVSYRERRRLDRELDRASRDIYRQKHDGQSR